MRSKIALPISTWFGCGYFPIAPGTVASAAALGIGYLLVEHAGWRAVHFGALSAIGIAPGILAAGITARESGLHDPSRVVVDEVLGQWITLTGLRSFNWKSYLGAFLLFRLFDIWKPAPVRQLESLPGGAGIVADDAMAGIYAALVLFIAGCFNLY